jgi:hypothetical protein
MPNRGGGELAERLNVRRDIEKPFSPNELAATIRTVLGEERPGRRSSGPG